MGYLIAVAVLAMMSLYALIIVPDLSRLRARSRSRATLPRVFRQIFASYPKPLCRLDALIARAEVLAKFGWRLAEDAFEHAVELGERLKTHVVGDLADPTARIQ